MWCAIGVLASLFRRQLTGKGGLVDASLLETTLGWMVFRTSHYQATGEVPVRAGTAARGLVPYQAYRCADGYLIVAASNERLFAKLAKALDRPDWIENERFNTNPKRVENREELNALLESILMSRPRSEWQEKFDAAGVPNSPIQGVDEVLAHPQVKALGILQETGDEAMKLVGLPLSFDGERPPLRNLAPRLGADNET